MTEKVEEYKRALQAIAGWENMDSNRFRETFPAESYRLRVAAETDAEMGNIAWEVLKKFGDDL